MGIAGVGAWFATEFRESRAVWKEIWAWGKAHNWKATAKGAFQLKHWGSWLGFLVAVGVTVTFTVLQTEISDYFERHTREIDYFPASFVFPILILIVMSFPPMLGQELVCLVIGLVWGLASGFFIVAPGTIFGELACFAVFRRWWSAKAKKIEHESVMYGCLVALMRHGNLGIIVASTVGMSIWVYLLAIILSLPKQFGMVLLGVGAGLTSAQRREQTSISIGVLVSTIVSSAIAANLLAHDPLDPATTLSASLVCHAWRTPAQRVLFGSTAIAARVSTSSSAARQKAAPWSEIASMQLVALTAANVDLPVLHSHERASSLPQILPVGSEKLKLRTLEVIDSFKWLAAFVENYADRLTLEVLHVTSSGHENGSYDMNKDATLHSNLGKLATTLRHSSLTLLRLGPDAPALLKAMPALVHLSLHLDYFDSKYPLKKLIGLLPPSIIRLTVVRNRDAAIGGHFPFTVIPFADISLLIASLPRLQRIDFPDCMEIYILEQAVSAVVVAECERRSIRMSCWEGFV
ncbi:hypothetical protein RQP46_004569 [Phenoliferia psychrophenolica]